MPIIIKPNITAFGPEEVFTAKGKFTRKYTRAAKEAFAEMGALWHDKILPLHFERGAKHRYDYAPRTQKYRARRARKGVAGDTDMVFTGAMRDQMERFATIKAFPTRATVNVQAPSYMTLRPNTYKGSTQPDKFSELSRMTNADFKQLETRLQTRIERELKK